MKKYQVKKYFDWGALKLEPLQYLDVSQADIKDCWMVTKESTQEGIIVGKKAFQNELKLGTIIEK